MRIVLFDYIFERDRPGTSGFSDLVWNWAKQLVKLGDEVHIVAPPYPKVPWYTFSLCLLWATAI